MKFYRIETTKGEEKIIEDSVHNWCYYGNAICLATFCREDNEVECNTMEEAKKYFNRDVENLRNIGKE